MIPVLAAGRATQTAQVLAVAGSASAWLHPLQRPAPGTKQLPQHRHGLTVVHLVSWLSSCVALGMMRLQ